MRDRFFDWLGRVTYRRYWLVLLITVAISVVAGWMAEHIKLDATWMSMLPNDSKSVASFERILEDFGEATNIIVAVEGPSRDRVTEIVDEIGPGLADIVIEYPGPDGDKVTEDAVKRVDFKYDLDYMRRHGLMLEKAKNLEKNLPLFTDYNLVPFLTHVNDVYEAQWVSDSDNLTKQEKDAERGLDGMFQLFETIARFAAGDADDSATVQAGVDALTIGDGYYLSSDKKMALIFVTPTVSVNDIDPTVVMVDSLDAHLQRLSESYPEAHFGMTGMHVVMRDEMAAGITDTVRNLLVAIVLILLIFIVSFRMFSGPLLAMIVLICGVTWDIGLAYLFYGQLNIMTAVCSVILLGLGIDYALHIISAYTESRHKGDSVGAAISGSFRKIGNGLLTGSLTTAVAFLSIATISSDAYREFGIVISTGIVCCLLVSLFMLPAMLVAKEKLWGLITKRTHPRRVDMEFHFLGRLTDLTTAAPWLTVVVALILTAVLAWFIPDLRSNSNYMDLEPEGLESIRLQREIPRRFHTSPDNMLAVFDSVEEVNEVRDRLNSKPAVGMVESIATVLPSQDKQDRRLPWVARIHSLQDSLPGEKEIDVASLTDQLYRLSDNIIEISSMAYVSGLDRVFDKANQFVGLDEDGNQVGVNRAEQLAEFIDANPDVVGRLREYQGEFRGIMKARAIEMSTPEYITLEMVPEADRSRYVSLDGKSYLMSFYARDDVWEGLFSSPFLETIQRNVPSATGSPVFMKEMVDNRNRDSAFAFAVAFLAIILLLLWDFKSIKAALIALIPLIVSTAWLFGLMGLLDIELTIINVIGFPLLLGIGIDDGVHVIHRYRVEGKSRLSYAMSSIGKAILLTSVTTMMGFGSLVSSEYRGYIGLGLLVTLGIGLCFVTSVILLPAILKLVWGGKGEHRWFFDGARR